MNINCNTGRITLLTISIGVPDLDAKIVGHSSSHADKVQYSPVFLQLFFVIDQAPCEIGET